MKPQEVIEFLTAWSNNIITLHEKRYKLALDLGIQALIYYKEMKRLGNIPSHFLLPGETEE